LQLSSSQLKHVTHIISTSCDFPAYNDAIDALIPVVTPRWIDHAIDKKKAPNPRTYCPDPQHYFHDVVVAFADEIPLGDRDAIIGGIQAMGGQYSEPITKLVTHIVALTLDSRQCRVMQEKNLDAIAVLPHWFDHCLRLGRRIVEEPYRLPEPSILIEQNMSIPPRVYRSTALDELNTMDPLERMLEPPAAPQLEEKEESVFKNKRIMLHQDLDVQGHLEQTLSQIISDGGGAVVDNVDEAEWLICHLRNTPEYFKAARAGKDTGNLNWLYFLISRNKYQCPMRRLLHYPYPENDIEGFRNAKITISNYTGEARVFLDSLVKAAGGSFTKNMTPDNTHLITAHMASEKCMAAKDWNIELVNHLWLEESYAKGKLQALSNSRYSFFPPRTNMTELVGQTPIDRVSLKIELDQNDPANASEDESDARSSSMPAVNGDNGTPNGRAAASGSSRRPARTPLAARLGNAELITPGSRGAKDRAISKLHGMATDIAAYEKERKRVGGVVYGGRRLNDPERVNVESNGRGRKRSIDEADEQQQDELAEDAPEESSPATKKHRRAPKSKRTSNETDVLLAPKPDPDEFPMINVLITGYKQELIPSKFVWSDFNINIVDSLSTKVDVLVVDRVLRTPKFLTSIVHAPVVVTIDWMLAMVAQHQRLSPESFMVEDPDWEDTQNQKFSDVLARAKRNRDNGGLLKGSRMYCTTNVRGKSDVIRAIIEANGGEAIQWNGTKAQIPQREENAEEDQEEEDQEEEDDALFGPRDLYLISEEADKPQWKKFIKHAKGQGYKPHVMKTEWLLTIASLQDLNVPREDHMCL